MIFRCGDIAQGNYAGSTLLFLEDLATRRISKINRQFSRILLLKYSVKKYIFLTMTNKLLRRKRLGTDPEEIRDLLLIFQFLVKNRH
jgi:hypothetical protein